MPSSRINGTRTRATRKFLTAPVTEDEKNRARERADKAGKTLAEYIRLRVVGPLALVLAVLVGCGGPSESAVVEAPAHDAGAPLATQPLEIHYADIVAWFGDSLTNGNPNRWFDDYQAWITASVVVNTFVNAGHNGDTADALLARVDRDVVSRRPTVVVVEVGINDYGTHVPLEEYAATMQTLATTLKSSLPGVRLAFAGPLALGEQYPDPAGDRLATYSLAANKVAVDNGAAFFDMRAAEQEYEAANNVPSPGVSPADLTWDGLHPTPLGASLMSRVAIDHTKLGARQ